MSDFRTELDALKTPIKKSVHTPVDKRDNRIAALTELAERLLEQHDFQESMAARFCGLLAVEKEKAERLVAENECGREEQAQLREAANYSRGKAERLGKLLDEAYDALKSLPRAGALAVIPLIKRIEQARR